MCGRYTLTRQDQIAADFEAALGDAPQSEWWRPRFNVAPTQPAPVVIAAPGGAGRAIELMRWGLVPHWAGPGRGRAPLMINARVESLGAKAIFRDALARRRCLVPADGFFEWLRDPAAGPGAKPQPIYMHPAPGALCAFAGIWLRGRTESGEPLASFAIITAPPNELVRPFHDRMPAVLPRGAWGAWLDPALGGEGARALLAAPEAAPDTTGWRAEPVSTLVNSVARDEPACIAPIAAPAGPAQRSLFE